MAKKYITSGGKNFISSREELKKYLKKGAKGFTTAIATNTAKRLQENTKRLIYDKYSPKMYKRTGELINSIVGSGYKGGEPTRNTGNGFESYVYFDINKFETFIPPQSKKKWGTHVLFDGTGGETAIRYIIDCFEGKNTDGEKNIGFAVKRRWTGRRGKRFIYRRHPVHMIEKTIKEVEMVLNKVKREIPDFEYIENVIEINLRK